MEITGRRIFTAVTLIGTAVTAYQVLSKPEPVAAPLSVEAVRANAESFDQKLRQLQATRSEGSDPAEVRFSSEEVSAELAEATGTMPGGSAPKPVSSPSPETTVAAGEVEVKSCQVKLEGDVARGQFVARTGGANIYVTLAGHLGSQNGYVTFDPTEFKIGELSIPVSLVNSALQKKLAEQREQLKLPEGIASLRVANGELVITQK